MLHRLNLTTLPDAFDRCIAFWHNDSPEQTPPGLTLNPLALELARRNYLLWHEEDKARRTDVSDRVIVSVKRAIDRLNQQRNDLIEQLDEAILAELSRAMADGSDEINSETPGSIVDRISILSLKIYHMNEDGRRTGIAAEHRERSLERVDVLRLQRSDLFDALARLMEDYLAGRKRMKLYKQFKMYNDPALNPELYGAAVKSS
jgi:Protein of unknown function (DUF4254)